jgi:amidase
MKNEVERILLEGSIARIHAAYASRRLSISEAVGYYLARIESVNPTINAVREFADDVMSAARTADTRLAAGEPQGALFGIPVLLKDNILTGDGMSATGGAAALRGFVPRREADLVRRLRASGALILGKANMTEFADYVSDIMPSEFSGAGGVVRNPYGCRYDRGQGSSVGPAAAVATSLVPVAIGTETQNSIQTPACFSSVYGYKPSIGRVSRAGIIPLVPSQDSAGPLTRSVADAALVMSVIAGVDCRDSLTLFAARDTATPTTSAIHGLRIGVLRRTIADRAELAGVMPVFEGVLARLAEAGAQLVDPCDLPSAEQLQDVRSSVFRTEFKAALDAFLADHDAPCAIDSLAALIAWNGQHPEAIPYGQSLLLAAQRTAGVDDPQYRADRRRDLVLSRTAGIDAALSLGADVLIAPMGAAAKCTGKAGAPVLAIPVGIDAAGVPVGITLFTAVGGDAALLRAGSAVAAVVGERRLPGL